MATRVIDDSKLQNIAVAIQSKDNGGQMTVDEMPGRIEAIPSGAPVVSNPALVLWDWEGTKLAAYSREDALALTELPAPSALPMYAAVDHELLVFQEWHKSLSEIKVELQENKNAVIEIGAVYTTLDGQNHNDWGNPRLTGANTINVQKRGELTIPRYTIEYCFSLKNVNCPSGVTSIGDYVFQYNRTCQFLIIPNTVTQIGIGSFLYNVALRKILLPNTITRIEAETFKGCYSLVYCSLPKNLNYIGNYSFEQNNSLYKIFIPNKVSDIGISAFNGCTSLCDITIESKPGLSNVNAFTGLPANYRIYVPHADLSWFETGTNWSSIYSQGHIVAIEDYIDYLESIGFNVDKYKGAA